MAWQLLDIYQTVCNFTHHSAERSKYAKFRAKYLQPIILVKQAFDTRRINQNTEINPRRNLQYYQRSEPYIDDQTAAQVQLFFKVKAAADQLREQFVGEPDWLDSHTRILCNAVDQTLRVEQKDFDYGRDQFNYLSELLYVRYRLRPEDIARLSQHELRNIILNKDERLVRQSLFINYKQDLNKNGMPSPVNGQDNLIEKLFGNVKANSENKNVKRSVNITITDSIDEKDDIKKI